MHLKVCVLILFLSLAAHADANDDSCEDWECNITDDSDCLEGHICKIVNIDGLNEEIQKVLNDDNLLPGGKYEETFDVKFLFFTIQVGLLIENINIDMSADSVKVMWKLDDEEELEYAALMVNNMNADFSIDMDITLNMGFSEKSIFKGKLELDLENANVALDMGKDEDGELHLKFCDSDIDKLRITSTKDPNVKTGGFGRLINMFMDGFDLGSMLGGDIPEEFGNLFKEVLSGEAEIDMEVCGMIEAILGLVNKFSENEDAIMSFLQEIQVEKVEELN